MLIETTAQKKIIVLSKRIRIVQGGTSSSKTFSIIPLPGLEESSNPVELSDGVLKLRNFWSQKF